MPKPQYHYDIEQGSLDWHLLRRGRLGGSSASVLLTAGKRADRLGAGAITEAIRNMAGMVFGEQYGDYKSPAMERGNELESEAIMAYEDATGEFTEVVGYITYGTFLGYSPDRLTLSKKLVEVKCPLGPEVTRLIRTGTIDPDHMAQMQFGLFVTGLTQCDYVVYHPQLTKPIIHHVHRNPATQETFRAKTVAYAKECRSIIRTLGMVARTRMD